MERWCQQTTCVLIKIGVSGGIHHSNKTAFFANASDRIPLPLMQLHMSPVVPQIFIFFVSFPHFLGVNCFGYSHY